ncbi:MAG: hypothetical protein C4520_18060 [Candidatus Abyssobacteria bacterium SURF_5]|uniref:Uncharacterized protein n=1 Tax=Abyssobacteria bacterium (strain SURF_5) TaxID=2093360 RepID=A0A3A4N453_ABYX5|nr:MAG: hypothetical protein C4520_18060 [Candidatus Abyssubacteria bacterium SURF_5]
MKKVVGKILETVDLSDSELEKAAMAVFTRTHPQKLLDDPRELLRIARLGQVKKPKRKPAQSSPSRSNSTIRLDQRVTCWYGKKDHLEKLKRERDISDDVYSSTIKPIFKVASTDDLTVEEMDKIISEFDSLFPPAIGERDEEREVALEEPENGQQIGVALGGRKEDDDSFRAYLFETHGWHYKIKIKKARRLDMMMKSREMPESFILEALNTVGFQRLSLLQKKRAIEIAANQGFLDAAHFIAGSTSINLFNYGHWIVYAVFLLAAIVNVIVARDHFRAERSLLGILAIFSIFILPRVALAFVLLAGRRQNVSLNMPPFLRNIYPKTMRSYGGDLLSGLFIGFNRKKLAREAMWLAISLVPVVAFLYYNG